MGLFIRGGNQNQRSRRSARQQLASLDKFFLVQKNDVENTDDAGAHGTASTEVRLARATEFFQHSAGITVTPEYSFNSAFCL